jgi:hypothetical protein
MARLTTIYPLKIPEGLSTMAVTQKSKINKSQVVSTPPFVEPMIVLKHDVERRSTTSFMPSDSFLE